MKEKLYLHYYFYISKEKNDYFEITCKQELKLDEIHYIGALLNKPVKIKEISPQKVETYFKKFLFSERSKADYIASGLQGKNDIRTSEKIAVNFNDAPVIRLVNSILEEAINDRSSDIHLEPEEKELKARYRIDGDLATSLTFPLNYFEAVASRIKYLAKLDITQKLLPQDGKARVDVNGVVLDLRVSTIPGKTGESIVIRILNREQEFVELGKLGIAPKTEAHLRKLLQLKSGLMLLTGPTGSGKTTTLYSMLKVLNREETKIVTVEDPIEYEIEGITQVEVNNDQGMTFPSMLRHFLRHDPDIIMVGEIRDEETARIAVQASLTGHLVISTLHTNDTVSSITRLIDLGVDPYLISSSLKAVISQRLVKKLCLHCRKKAAIKEISAELGKKIKALKLKVGTSIKSQSSCRECRQTGYRGRSAGLELLEISEPIQKLINGDKPEENIRSFLKKSNYHELNYFLIDKFLKGETSSSEVEKHL